VDEIDHPLHPTVKSMSNEIVRHPGIVTATERNTVRVKILQVSACAHCVAKGACAVADMEEKVVEVENYVGSPLKPGSPVTLTMQRSSGNRAIRFGYFFPFLVVLLVLITGSFLTKNEGVLGLLAIGCLAPYYLILYTLRDKLKQKFVIRIEEPDENL